MSWSSETYHDRLVNRLLNTSYPLSPSDWLPYKVEGGLEFVGESELSFYVHIPFCPHLCTYCEYTRMLLPEEELQKRYLQTLRQDIASFRKCQGDFMLRGFDIGGGTPTVLSTDYLHALLDIYDEAVDGLSLAPDFEPSIEGTAGTLISEKLKAIARHGIYRLSMGLQSTSQRVLREHQRQCASSEQLMCVIDGAHNAGIHKINLDLMYGIKYQSLASISADCSTIRKLLPEQVTLYELRTNMTHQQPPHDAEWLFEAYTLFYEQLTAMGYHARFGQNTFSISATDQGLSSYLRHRMIHGGSYKGFGISAQSMSSQGVAYNKGKNDSNLFALLSADTFELGDTYHLPPHELCAKYIAISAYGGCFSLKRASELLQTDARSYFQDQIDYCLTEGLMHLSDDGDRLMITSKGYLHYGAVFSLFIVPYTL